MDIVYILEHVYEVDDIDEIKFIGVFSSEEKAKLAIDKLKNIKGFKDFPVECFQISENIIDNIGWQEGFIKWVDAN
jgi:hypothetical protein